MIDFKFGIYYIMASKYYIIVSSANGQSILSVQSMKVKSKVIKGGEDKTKGIVS